MKNRIFRLPKSHWGHIVGLVSFFLFIASCSEKENTAPDAGDEDSSPEDCQPASLGEIALPADDAFHESPFEWIYWTGHLQTAKGRWFGFEAALFKFAMGASAMNLANFAITDVDDKSFHYIGIPQFGEQDATIDGFSLSFTNDEGAVSAEGGNGLDQLSGEVDQYKLTLTLTDSKAPVAHHEDGYHQYQVGGDTYYYSRTRMGAAGTLTIDGVDHQISGMAWFDHQWGDLQPVVDAGWDWLALQLDDNRELMVAFVHDGDGLSLAGGTLVEANCDPHELSPADLTVTALDSWTSPHSGCTYPMGWRVQTGDIDVQVIPILKDQELVSDHNTYWEGAALVSGSVTGRAYVELNGHCE